jgi:hypothetical protein
MKKIGLREMLLLTLKIYIAILGITDGNALTGEGVDFS